MLLAAERRRRDRFVKIGADALEAHNVRRRIRDTAGRRADQRCLPEASIMSFPQGIEIPGHGAEEALRRPSVASVVARDRYLGARAVATSAEDAESAALAAKVRQLTNELHEFYDNSLCGFHSLDATGLIVQINDTELAWLGYKRDEVVGRMRLTDIVPRQYYDFFRQHFVLLKERGQRPDLEYEMRRKDGTTFPVLVNVTAVKDADGRFVRSRATVLDISARRKLEKNELRESELRSTAILHAALDCIVSIDSHGVIIEFNPAAEKTFGYTREQAVGNDVSTMIIPPAVRSAHRRGLARYLATGESSLMGRRVQVTAMRSDGAEFPAELTIIPVPLQHQTTFTAYLRDITREKWREQELRRYADELRVASRKLVEVQEAERRALANELHDLIGQKLTALNINLSIVKIESMSATEEQVGPRLEDSLKLVEETIESIRGVMTELRPAVLDDYGLGPALRWYAKQFGNRTHVATKVIEHGPGRRLPSTAEEAFFRIAQEALANIAKYAGAEKVTVSLDTTSNATCLTIADDGHGFDPSIRPQPSSDHGWGLMIMRERAAAVGADLTIESALGQGTRIIVTLRGDAS
jgi:PAS domain S-box-containing protein